MRSKLLAAVGLALVVVLGANTATVGAADPVFFPYDDPTTPASPAYTSITCAIDLSSIPDYTVLTSLTGCGATLNFSPAVEKRTVPASWFSHWGEPPDVEANNVPVLWSNFAESVTMTISNAGRRTVGFEAQPNQYNTQTMTAVFKDVGGATLGTISKPVTTTVPGDTDGSAALFAARTKGTPKIKSVTVSSGPAELPGFAMGALRVSSPSA